MAASRFVLIPGQNRFNREQALSSSAFMARSARMIHRGSPSIPIREENNGIPSMNVIASLEAGQGMEAMLVELDDTQRLALRTTYPDLRVVQEGTAEMAFARATLQPIPLATMAGTTLATSTLTIRVKTETGKPVSKAQVDLITNARTDPPTGVSGITNAKGEIKLIVPKALRRASCLRVEPQHSYWHRAESDVSWSGTRPTLEVVCPGISQPFDDALQKLGVAGQDHDGEGVVVAVIDGGAGAHRGLPDFTGANFARTDRPSDDIGDNGIGHGTHVAGIIASRRSRGGIQGMAPGVTLRIYRVYEKGSVTTGAFSVAAAIHRAVEDGADIINLSLTLPKPDPSVTLQLQRARAAGVICVAAAGNAGGDVLPPAQDDAVLGVSALGWKGTWPKGAAQVLDVRAKPAGKNKKLFVAKFSCVGPEIDLAGPGVGIVSLYPKHRFAVMNGTSMAAPAVAGAIARKLAGDPAILSMPRGQARSNAIVALALNSARSLGFPTRFQGSGIVV